MAAPPPVHPAEQERHLMAAAAKADSDRGIAIIGMACVYPGAHSPEQLWTNVLAGRREFRRLPAERLPRSEYYDPDPAAPHRTYSDRLAVITGWRFDPMEFRIPPVTVDASDITHWLALHTARGALRDAAIDLDLLDRARVAVVLGNSLTGEFARSHNLRLRWPHVERAVRNALASSGVAGAAADALVATIEHHYQSRLPDITEDTLAGNMSNTIAGRIAGWFDLGGGAFTLDGACSSSILALANACSGLLAGDIDCALAGGVDVSLDPFELVGFAKARALAKDDIKPYDEHAAGMLPGEGCGVFVLMRAADARRAGHRIRAVIRGWGVSSDGAGAITAPGVDGQKRALRKAYSRAGYSIGDVGLIEGHGTGTPLGDRIELTAIGELLEETPGAAACWIGSIKGNIGHCKAAAGAAGLVKAVMALERRIIPPTGGCDRPSPVFDRAHGRLRPALTGGPWLANGAPRRASVSAMGFGGANAHITLEEAESGDVVVDQDLELLGSAQSTETVFLAAQDERALLAEARSLAALTARISRSEMVDLAATLAVRAAAAVRRGEAVLRLAVTARSPWHLEQTLHTVVQGLESGAPIDALASDDIAAGRWQRGHRPKLAALYPGQGAQHLGMGAHVLRRHAWARAFQDGIDVATRDVLPRPLGEYVYPDRWSASDETVRAWTDALRDTRVAQPAIVASSLATLGVLRRLGLEPDVHLGHSLGEVTALCAAGALDEVTAVRVAALRGRAMAELDVHDAGAMLAISAPAARVEALIAGMADVVVSNVNSPRQTVAAGSTHGIADLARRCEAAPLTARRIPVSHAFHSHIVAPAAERLARELQGVAFEELRGTVVSSSTADVLDRRADLRSLLADHVRLPVLFADAIRRTADERPAMWVEVGPGGILTSFVRDTLGVDTVCLPTDVPGEDGWERVGRVCAEAFVRGFDFDIEALFAGRHVEAFDVDHYDPGIIVNPCERPVGELPAATPAGVRDLAALAAAGITGAAGRVAGNGSGSKEGHAPEPPSSPDESLEAFAISWIAQRTGFPRESITPEMRLRDHLNLDSIKVGELWVRLSKHAGVETAGDPAALANETIARLVARLDDAAAEPARNAYSDARLLDVEWVGTFRTETVEVPLPPPDGTPDGRVLLFSAAGDGDGALEPLIGALCNAGVPAEPARARDLEHGAAPADLGAIVVILPEVESSFLDCAPNAFDARIRMVSQRMYHVLRWAMRGGASNLRCLVVRPGDAGNGAQDLDGGAGLLRTFFLENPGSTARWIRTPAGWHADRLADVIARELSTRGQTGCFSWDEHGIRRTDVAVPLRAPEPSRLRLTPDDVAFVTGGGKGITAELALGLARATGVRLVLAGSSPAPAPGASAETDELARTFRRLEHEGLAFTYVQCDVTDPASIRRAVEQAEALLGPITMLLHGAGITRFAALRDKEYAEFRRCVDVKVHGLYNLLSVLDPARLKGVHVLSSVLGRTGMRSQSDYTLANAWLDRALAHLAERHPDLHALSLAYSVWEGTGLGERLGALDFLRSVGVNPIPVHAGVAAYMRLVREHHAGSSFVITGRLSADLETLLYGPVPAMRGRYLERIRHRVPGTELVADASLSFASDPYLADHVYDGTPLFPGVMAMEAMAQAACAMMGTDRRPSLHDVRFARPLIVSPDAQVVMRTYAIREEPDGGGSSVRVWIRSAADGFRADHFTATCVFARADAEEQVQPSRGGNARHVERGEPAAAAAILNTLETSSDQPPAIRVEDFVPVPLFQGALFRHIQRIHRLDAGRESLTTVRIPDVRYFDNMMDERMRAGQPAARDSFLQSGALLLPPGTLPRALDELRIHRVCEPGEVVHCHVRAAQAVHAGSDGPQVHHADYSVYDANGRLVEEALGLRLETPAAPTAREGAPVPVREVPSRLCEAIGDAPHRLVVVRAEEAEEGTALDAAMRDSSDARVGAHRRASARANAMAAGRAASAFRPRADERSLALMNGQDGRPFLRLAGGRSAPWLDGLDLSLADCRGHSFAFVSTGRVGVDVEPVEPRSRTLWRELLGERGYGLASELVTRFGGAFDAAATRVWTLLEAARKATGQAAAAPRIRAARAGWLRFEEESSGQVVELASILTQLEDGAPAMLSIARSRSGP
jgi:enediyne polyketide synthase